MSYDEPDYVNDGETARRLIAEVLEAYPDKSRKRRQKHLERCQGRLAG